MQIRDSPGTDDADAQSIHRKTSCLNNERIDQIISAI